MKRVSTQSGLTLMSFLIVLAVAVDANKRKAH